MKFSIDYTLYLVTDRNIMSTSTIEESVEHAIKGGCTVVQIREKTASSLEFFHIAQRVQKVTNKYNVPLVINDRVDIALAIDADGVHIGQSDLPATTVRGLIGSNKVLGVSAGNLSEALAARDNGADYLGVGAMFATSTKTDANLTTLDELKKIRSEISLPIIVIGGISTETVPLFRGTGIDGIAVVSAIISQSNIEKSARELKALFKT